jgi:hypothetical protein
MSDDDRVVPEFVLAALIDLAMRLAERLDSERRKPRSRAAHAARDCYVDSGQA